MTGGIMTRAELLVNAILSNPPTDNAQLLSVATALEQDATQLEEYLETWRFQARRLRDYAGARQARMDGSAIPENATTPRASPRG